MYNIIDLKSNEIVGQELSFGELAQFLLDIYIENEIDNMENVLYDTDFIRKHINKKLIIKDYSFKIMEVV